VIKTKQGYQKREGLYQKVYDVVVTIPKGKVATYGQIAKILGTSDARKVGWALAGNKDPEVPCHRVVDKEGALAKNFGKSLAGGSGWEEQRKRLEAEGVTFVDDTHVDLEKHLWDKK